MSGDDPLTLPMMSVGAKGVVSVASNAVPSLISRLVHSALSGDYEHARELHLDHLRLFQIMLGLDTNPLPIKTALALMGRVQEVFRLPMCQLDAEKRDLLEETLKEFGVI